MRGVMKVKQYDYPRFWTKPIHKPTQLQVLKEQLLGKY